MLRGVLLHVVVSTGPIQLEEYLPDCDLTPGQVMTDLSTLLPDIVYPYTAQPTVVAGLPASLWIEDRVVQ
jgi:hypothetical protein